MIRIIQLIALNFLLLSIKSSESPKFCNGLDCPEFELYKTENNIDIRNYKESYWVSIEMKNGNQDQLMSPAFMTLFKYISGENEGKQKIEMSAPVLVKVNSQTPFSQDDQVGVMSFYLGSKYQTENSPKPTNEKVWLQKLEKKQYAVISYSGYSSRSDQEKYLRILGDYLKSNKLNFVTEYYYFAGYDSPFKFLFRHNEVWVEIK